MIDEAALAKVIEALAPALDRALPWEPGLALAVRADELAVLIAAARDREQLRGELMEQRRIFDIELGNSHVAYLAVNTSYRQAERERDEARAALDQARVQLAGCLIAAEGGDTAEVCQGDYAWTLALETTRKLYAQIAERDVALAGAHDREDALQAALTSQQQATEEAMRRAEEARREMAAIRSELLLP